MAYGLWPMAYGLWPMGYGLWAMAYGLWPVGYGLWAMGYGSGGRAVVLDTGGAPPSMLSKARAGNVRSHPAKPATATTHAMKCALPSCQAHHRDHPRLEMCAPIPPREMCAPIPPNPPPRLEIGAPTPSCPPNVRSQAF